MLLARSRSAGFCDDDKLLIKLFMFFNLALALAFEGGANWALILFDLLINSIEQFLITPENFNKAIKVMIEKEYITQSIENDIIIYTKLLY